MIGIIMTGKTSSCAGPIWDTHTREPDYLKDIEGVRQEIDI